MDFHITFTLVLIAVAIIAYAFEERIPLEATAIGVVAVLLLVFQIYPLTNAAGVRLITAESLLAGFANPALVTVMSLLVLRVLYMIFAGPVVRSTHATERDASEGRSNRSPSVQFSTVEDD